MNVAENSLVTVNSSFADKVSGGAAMLKDPQLARPATTDLRLRRHADFQQVYTRARKQYAKEMAFFFVLRSRPETASSRAEAASETTTPEQGSNRAALSGPAAEGPRIGLTVGKVLGKAHERNRIKRRLRAAIRAHAGVLAGVPVDVVLHPRRSVMTIDWTRLDGEVAQVFRTIRKLLGNPPSATPGQEPDARGRRSARPRTPQAAGAVLKPRPAGKPDRR